MDRSILSDEQFERVAPHLPGKVGDPGRTANNRLFLEAVFWIARTGAPWRDLEPRFGLWNSVYRRFRRWAEKGVFESLFKLLSPTRTSNTPSSTAPSSGSTSMAPAQGGDSKSGHRPIARRADDENRRARRCARQPDALPAASRPTPRQHRRCAVDRGDRLRGPAGRQGLRHRLDPRRTGQPRRHGRNSTQGRSGALYPVRLRDVQMAPSRREFLLRSQAVPAHRHEIRKNRHELCRDDTPRRLSPRTQMNVHRP